MPETPSLPQSKSEPPTNVGFEFVRSLAAELSSGKIELPSFPEVAMQVKKVLADPNFSIDQVVRVIGSEPALAARLMRVANAATFNRSGKHITDLRTGINRIGFTMVRSASMAFAVSQMRRGARLERLQVRLNDLWQRSTTVAALAFVIARTCTDVSPDEAMLTGMMHGVGKLYIMTRAAQHPELFVDNATMDAILQEWHASIGKAILENWDFSDLMASAVGEQEELGREDEVKPDLRDVLAMAIVTASYLGDTNGLEIALNGIPVAIRLGLNRERIETVLNECATEVAALSEALGS